MSTYVGYVWFAYGFVALILVAYMLHLQHCARVTKSQLRQWLDHD